MKGNNPSYLVQLQLIAYVSIDLNGLGIKYYGRPEASQITQ